MEDLRVLEQQQRDSQRLLSSIKRTKQYKLDQRSSLESKLSALKYSNGQSRAQLLHAREVLSKSTRELANAQLRSDRSKENLKKFDEKLKKTLGFVRSLYSKRRKLDNAIVRLENAAENVHLDEEKMINNVKRMEMELEDAQYREQLLVKSIQGAKLKVQEYVEDTTGRRSELSGLEADLTSVRQLETSTKFRAENVRADIEKEKTRFEKVKGSRLGKMELVKSEKMELESVICDLNVQIGQKKTVMEEEWEKCVAIQKEEGLPISVSQEHTDLDVDGLRMSLEDDKVALLEKKAEEAAVVTRVKALEHSLSILQIKNDKVKSEREQMNCEVEEKRETEEKLSTENSGLITELKAEYSKVKELEDILSSLKTEGETCQIELEQKKEELVSILVGENEKLAEITSEIDQLDNRSKLVNEESVRERVIYRENIEEAKKAADETKASLDEVQKRADELSKLPCVDDDEEMLKIAKKENEDLETITDNQMKFLAGELNKAMIMTDILLLKRMSNRFNSPFFLHAYTEYPSLASLDLSYDSKTSKESQVLSALCNLRSVCDQRIEAARVKYEEVLTRMKTHEEEEKKAQAATLEKKRREEDETRARLAAEEKAQAAALEIQLREQEEVERKERARVKAEEKAKAKSLERQLREDEEAEKKEIAPLAAEEKAEAEELERQLLEKEEAEEKERASQVAEKMANAAALEIELSEAEEGDNRDRACLNKPKTVPREKQSRKTNSQTTHSSPHVIDSQAWSDDENINGKAEDGDDDDFQPTDSPEPHIYSKSLGKASVPRPRITEKSGQKRGHNAIEGEIDAVNTNKALHSNRYKKTRRGYGSRRSSTSSEAINDQGTSIETDRAKPRKSRSSNSLMKTSNAISISRGRSKKSEIPSPSSNDNGLNLKEADENELNQSTSNSNKHHRHGTKRERISQRTTSNRNDLEEMIESSSTKVRFQDEPTVADTYEIDQSLTLTQSSSSKKKPRSIIVKSRSRRALEENPEKLDIFSHGRTSCDERISSSTGRRKSTKERISLSKGSDLKDRPKSSSSKEHSISLRDRHGDRSRGRSSKDRISTSNDKSKERTSSSSRARTTSSRGRSNSSKDRIGTSTHRSKEHTPNSSRSRLNTSRERSSSSGDRVISSNDRSTETTRSSMRRQPGSSRSVTCAPDDYSKGRTSTSSRSRSVASRERSSSSGDPVSTSNGRSKEITRSSLRGSSSYSRCGISDTNENSKDHTSSSSRKHSRTSRERSSSSKGPTRFSIDRPKTATTSSSRSVSGCSKERSSFTKGHSAAEERVASSSRDYATGRKSSTKSASKVPTKSRTTKKNTQLSQATAHSSSSRRRKKSSGSSKTTRGNPSSSALDDFAFM